MALQINEDKLLEAVYMNVSFIKILNLKNKKFG